MNSCNLLRNWGQLIRERMSQPWGTINIEPSTRFPEPAIGIINNPVPEHHKVVWKPKKDQAG